MKIPIYDSEQGWLGAIPIQITDAGSGQQRITVRVPSLKFFDIIRPRPAAATRKQQVVSETTKTSSPVSSTITREKTVEKAPPNVPPKAERPRGIEISFVIPVIPVLPSVSSIKKRLRTVSRKNLIAAGLIGMVIISLPIIRHFLLYHSTPVANTTFHSGPPQLTKGNPSFSTVLPAGKNINTYGGWTRISPPDRAPVYGYADKIGNVLIDVSEQQLPSQFQTDPSGSIQKLAENFGATNILTTRGTTVYVGTATNGAQSVIFTKNGLLVLIKSVSPITNTAWISYINALR